MNTAKLLWQRLACASDGGGIVDSETDGWLDERWRSVAESAAVLLLLDSLLWCSPVAIVVVTDVTDISVSEARLFIILSLDGERTNGRWSCRGER
jgi:hypothetical protein